VSVLVRFARPDEDDVIAELMVRSYVGEDLIAATNPYVNQLRDARGRRQHAELLVAERDGLLVGTVTYCPQGSPWTELAEPGEGEFRMLAVDSAHRGYGIGLALVRTCLDRAEQLGQCRVVISTTHEMTTAHRLYESLGFRRAERRDWSPRKGVHLWAYELDLADRTDRAERPRRGDGSP
jgi:ribosomal protein S18 acetylase RimI-like enzyme